MEGPNVYGPMPHAKHSLYKNVGRKIEILRISKLDVRKYIRLVKKLHLWFT